MSDNNNQNEYGGRGCIQLLTLGAFCWGALMMYPKTVDLLSNFAPNEFMGYTDMAGWWAMGSAMLIEGVMVILKFKMWIYPARNLVEWAWDGILTIAPFVMSALAQVFDGMLVRDTLTSQPEQIQMMVDWGVPLLPSFVIGLMIIYAMIESAPPRLFGGIQQGGGKLPKLTLPDLGMLNPMNWFSRGNGHDKRKGNERRDTNQKQNQPPKKDEKQRAENPTEGSGLN